MLKSPLRYPGGKSRAIDTIAKLIPDFDEFREPFLGGGSVFVYVKQRYPNKKFWVNDLYSELYKFWEMTQKDVDAVIAKVYEWKTKYTIGKELYQFLNENLENFNDLERAAAFFVYNRITFSGTTLSGGYSEYIRELFSFANIQSWNLTYGMRNVSENSDQNGKELFISNYALQNQQRKNEQLQLFD